MGFDMSAERSAIEEKAKKDQEKSARLAEKQAKWQERYQKNEADRKTRAAPASASAGFICGQCGQLGKPKLITKGNLLAEIGAWLLCLLLIPFTFGVSLIFAIVYSIWRHLSRFKGCPHCQGQMIKTSSPVGQKMLAEYHRK